MLTEREFRKLHTAILEAISEKPSELTNYRVLADLHKENPGICYPDIERASIWMASHSITLCKTDGTYPIKDHVTPQHPSKVRYSWTTARVDPGPCGPLMLQYPATARLPFLIFRALKDNPNTTRFRTRFACYKTVRKALGELGRALRYLDFLCKEGLPDDVQRF